MYLVRLRTTVGMIVSKVPVSLQALHRSTLAAVSGPTAARAHAH